MEARAGIIPRAVSCVLSSSLTMNNVPYFTYSCLNKVYKE